MKQLLRSICLLVLAGFGSAAYSQTLPVVIELPADLGDALEASTGRLGDAAGAFTYLGKAEVARLYERARNGQPVPQLLAAITGLDNLVDEDGRSYIDIDEDDLPDKLKNALRLSLCQVSTGTGILQFDFHHYTQ